MASEVKAVLDSWVRYEQQEKEAEQAQLVKAVVENVMKTIGEDKTQKEALAWAVAEVERKSPFLFFIERSALRLIGARRARQEQGDLRENVVLALG